MKKKALSFDEKRARLLAIFHERKEVFNLKELEKHGSKAGIVLQTVKEVLEALMSDNLVESDKIGSANFFWSLPSRAYQSLTMKKEEYNSQIAKLNTDKEEIMVEIALAQQGKEETEERREKVEKLKSLRKQYEARAKELEKYKKNDPERLTALEKQAVNFKNEANKWTDNVFTCKQWMGKKFPAIGEDQINSNFNIPEDLDNLP
mmetsp:Transcript_75932/g.88300  ORF Transcript_75932/g.88300 Transcript_75932/m.88300 type:complete len:205 (-) Transcript_75932:180-794(-)